MPSFYTTGPLIFQKSRSHLQILHMRSVTWSKFDIEDPQLWSDLWTSLLPDAFCLVHVNWYTLLYVRGKNCITMLKILDATIQDLVTPVTRCRRFVNPCSTQRQKQSWTPQHTSLPSRQSLMIFNTLSNKLYIDVLFPSTWRQRQCQPLIMPYENIFPTHLWNLNM
jgi:hypothetical protein